MKKIVVLFTTIMLSACGSDDNESSSGSTANNPYPQATLVAIGDSICNGQTASLGWADLLRNQGYNLVYKDCKNGRQVHKFGSVIPEIVDAYHPTHILIMLGTNDAINGHTGSAISALQSMANQAADRGVIPVFSTIPPSTRTSEIGNNVRVINSGIRGLNASRIADSNPSVSISMLTDGVHPNDTGQNIIVETFAGTLR